MINPKTSKTDKIKDVENQRFSGCPRQSLGNFVAQKIPEEFSRNQRFLWPRKSFGFSRESQSWSIDIILGVIVFMAAFFVFYALLNAEQGSKAGSLEEEASIIIKQVTSDGSLVRIVDGNEINVSRLNELKNLSYGELKERLKIEGDFCIYLEDENGNIILINNSYKGIGAATINLSGAPCSQK